MVIKIIIAQMKESVLLFKLINEYGMFHLIKSPLKSGTKSKGNLPDEDLVRIVGFLFGGAFNREGFDYAINIAPQDKNT